MTELFIIAAVIQEYDYCVLFVTEIMATPMSLPPILNLLSSHSVVKMFYY